MQALKSAPSLSIPNAFQAAGRKISVLRYIMHANRDSQHRAHCDQISTNMSIRDCAMVSAPVIHNIICTLELHHPCHHISVANHVHGHV